MSATLKKDVRDRIAGLSAVTSAGARVSINRNPQEVRAPRIIVNRQDFDPFATLGADDDSLISERFMIDVRGKTNQEAEELADAIVDDLQALSGNLGSSRKVVGTQIESQTDDYEADEAGGDQGEGVVSILCSIMHVPQ